MKKDHEDKFSGIIQKMSNSIMDYGKVDHYTTSKMCHKLSTVLGYGCSDEENAENSKILNEVLNKLIDVPIETRCLLAIMVSRSFPDRLGNCNIPLHEVEAAICKDSSYMLMQIDMLKRRGLISEPDADEYGCPFCVLYGDFESGWNYWNDIREFCRKTGISTNEICVNLNFSLFD